MKIAFTGLWHLGTVMSAVFARAGHDVVAFDASDIVERLRRLQLPVAEPGLGELIEAGILAEKLRFEFLPSALAECEIVWATYDTPVREDGTADVEIVFDSITRLYPFLQKDALVVVSSQIPVGSVAELERRAETSYPMLNLRFASSPENLRLGRSIEYLTHVDRFVVGVRNARDAALLREAFAPLSPNVEVMAVESAEMTKHAVNAFLATSVAFANELAALCERTGADAREVERGLKTDVRIGSRAYVRAGGPYAGGTLARDVTFIIENERRCGIEPLFFHGVRAANDYHGSWLQRRFMEVVGEPARRTIAILGLVYKPGTDTLRGSSALMVANWFSQCGGRVIAYDPALRGLPESLQDTVVLRSSLHETLQGADAAFIGTEYDQFKALNTETFLSTLSTPIIFDPGRCLSDAIQTDQRLRYYGIGVASRT